MALGKAFIEVHADTKPFARELASQLNKILAASESDVRKGAGKLGETISEETGKGIRRNRKKVSDGVDDTVSGILGGGAIGRLAKGIVDTIDDGLSGLPAEIKATLGAALAVAAPIAFAIGAQIASSLSAGLLLLGGAGLAALIGSQFEEVRTVATNVFAALRQDFLEAASAFTGSFFTAIEAVRQRFTQLQPELVLIFAKITRTLEPLVDAVFDFIEAALPGISAAFSDIDKFLVPLQRGLSMIGESVGNFFQTITENENSAAAFEDLLIFVSQIIDLFTLAVNAGLDLFGVIQDIGVATGVVGDTVTSYHKYTGGVERATEGAARFRGQIISTIVPLEQQEKAIEEGNRALDRLTGLLFESKQGEIDFQRSVDDLTASVAENGRTLNINKEAGRQNAEQLLRMAQIAIDTRDTQIELGVGVDTAQAAFVKQRDEIYRVARNLGLSEKATEDLIGVLLKLPPPKATGVTKGTITNLQSAISLIRTLLGLLPGLGGLGSVLGAGEQGIAGHANGGVFSSPHLGVVAEKGTEAIIPLNNPARASQVMAQAGLDRMVSPTVNVYIGNEQIQAYIAVETNRQLAVAARGMSYGTRGI